jgi:hypothetical protein
VAAAAGVVVQSAKASPAISPQPLTPQAPRPATTTSPSPSAVTRPATAAAAARLQAATAGKRGTRNLNGSTSGGSSGNSGGGSGAKSGGQGGSRYGDVKIDPSITQQRPPGVGTPALAALRRSPGTTSGAAMLNLPPILEEGDE